MPTPPAPYRSFPNSFRQRILAGETVIGCWCSLANPITTEVLGVAGFDWLLLDGEHSPNDLITFIPQLMALKDSPSAPVVRPSWNNPVELKRLLDGGFHNFLIPFIETAEEARRAVAATRYPPQGFRGVSVSQRGNRYGTVEGYFDGANEQICVMLQIESAKGVAAAAEIAVVDGVDGLFIGPSDLASRPARRRISPVGSGASHCRNSPLKGEASSASDSCSAARKPSALKRSALTPGLRT